MKKTVLIFTRYYLPGYKAGGPIRSVANLVNWLGDDFHFKIITSDRDLGDATPYEKISLNSWIKHGNSEIHYTEKGRERSEIKRILNDTNADLIYLNSFFDFQYSILPVLFNRYTSKLPVLLAPRGEFSEGAIEIKAKKKKLFIHLSKLTGFHKEVQWAVSNVHEKNDLNTCLNVPESQIYVMPNLPADMEEQKAGETKKEKNSVKIAFISRICPKKNVEFMIDVLHKLSCCSVRLDLYGVIEDEAYWQSISQKIAVLPDHAEVHHKGSIPHERVHRTLQNYHLFFLPTRGENFGHAIFEAMIAGIPVLISDQTPWRDLEKKNLGWDLPLNQPEAFRDVISKVAGMTQKELHGIREKVFQSIRKLAIQEDVRQNRSVFQSILET